MTRRLRHTSAGNVFRPNDPAKISRSSEELVIASQVGETLKLLQCDGNAGAAFLLAQVGAHAASKFAERLVELKLVPAHAGIFRICLA
jgi:hypothetical protein